MKIQYSVPTSTRAEKGATLWLQSSLQKTVDLGRACSRLINTNEVEVGVRFSEGGTIFKGKRWKTSARPRPIA